MEARPIGLRLREWWEQIARFNRIEPGKPLLIGQSIIIPTPHQGMDHMLAGKALAAHPAAHNDPYNPHGAMLHQNHDLTRSLHESFKSGPFQKARPVLFPEFKYELEGMVLEENIGVAECRLSFTGEIVMKRNGIISGGLTLTTEGIESEYKKEADGVLKMLFWKSIVRFDRKKAEVS